MHIFNLLTFKVLMFSNLDFDFFDFKVKHLRLFILRTEFFIKNLVFKIWSFEQGKSQGPLGAKRPYERGEKCGTSAINNFAKWS